MRDFAGPPKHSTTASRRPRLRAYGALALGCIMLFCNRALPAEPQGALARRALMRAALKAQAEPNSAQRSALKRRIALQKSRLSGRDALAECEGITTATDAIRARGAAAVALGDEEAQLAARTLNSALLLFRHIEDRNLRVSELAFLAAEVAAVNPSRAQQAAAEITETPFRRYAFRQIAAQAPQAAWQDLQTQTLPPQLRELFLADLIAPLATTDLIAALALSEEISDNLLKSETLARLSFELPAADALAVTHRITDAALFAHAVRSAAVRLAPADTLAALQAVGSLEADNGSALAAVALAARHSDPVQAQALIEQIPTPAVRADALGLLCADLATEDLQAALDLAAAHPELPDWAQVHLCAALAQTDLKAAQTRAGSLADETARDAAFVAVARVAASTQPRAARDILPAVQDSAMRFGALRAAIRARAPADLAEARAMLGLAGGAQEVYALQIEIARARAPYHANEAVALLESLPDSPARQDALLDIAAAIGARDLDQGLQIAARAVPSHAARRALALKLARTDPERALNCAQEIKDPLFAVSTFCDIAEMLLGRAAAAAVDRPEILRIVEQSHLRPAAQAPPGAPVEIVSAAPNQLIARLPGAAAGDLYTLRYREAQHTFVWENLTIDAAGRVVLRDDSHLQPAQRLACPSRGSAAQPYFFDDFTKADFIGKKRLPYGIPVSTFGGAGYLSSAPASIHRDRRGNFWIYQNVRPWRITAFDSGFNYRFTLLFPDPVVALASDADANLYVLQERNYLSRFDADGRPLAHWKLPHGRNPGEFIQASGLAVDPLAGHIYLADKMLGRVSRFDAQLRPLPFLAVAWGWLGREDLGYTEIGMYQSTHRYRLDRPTQIRLGADNVLYAGCAYYLMRFDVTDGRQLDFGRSPVLGWGGTFTDSPHSEFAALNGHWQEYTFAGLDPAGNIYLSDTENGYAAALRLQIFSKEGEFLAKYDHTQEVLDREGGRVYIVPPHAVAFTRNYTGPAATVWLADGGGRIYESAGLQSGGRLYLGPGAPGRQFDLTTADPVNFTLEKQEAYITRQARGSVVTYGPGHEGTKNCEAERNGKIPSGARSIWIPLRLGEPAELTLFEGEIRLPQFDYNLELESEPGPFGTHYDFFRVTNTGGYDWEDVRFMAATRPPAGPSQ